MGSGSPLGGKAPNALRTIGEVVSETGIAAHVLRYWERQVPALQPVRRAGDRRYYRAEDVALIIEIARLIDDEGYTLEGAARAATGSRRKGAGADATDVAAKVRSAAAAAAAHGEGAVSLTRLHGLSKRLHNALDQHG